MKDFLDDAWSVVWTGGCALAVVILYMVLCAGPVAAALIGRLFSNPLRNRRKGDPRTPALLRRRQAWAFKGLPLGPRWQ